MSYLAPLEPETLDNAVCAYFQHLLTVPSARTVSEYLLHERTEPVPFVIFPTGIPASFLHVFRGDADASFSDVSTTTTVSIIGESQNVVIGIAHVLALVGNLGALRALPPAAMSVTMFDLNVLDFAVLNTRNILTISYLVQEFPAMAAHRVEEHDWMIGACFAGNIGGDLGSVKFLFENNLGNVQKACHNKGVGSPEFLDCVICSSDEAAVDYVLKIAPDIAEKSSSLTAAAGSDNLQIMKKNARNFP